MAECDPMECQGDGAGQNCADDPCWSCIEWAFGEVCKLRERIAELEADKVRLDWFAAPSGTYEGKPRLSLILDRWWRSEGDDIKGLIDAAMAAENEGEGE